MKPIPVVAIFDVGKTNKKLFLFDEGYNIVFERSARFNEIEDEDGFACENLESLKRSVFDALSEIKKLDQFELKAVNFSAYGASFVYLDESGEPVAPLYNYLKPYPVKLEKLFYDTYGGKTKLSFETASPALGNLNSGLQLYCIKHEKPDLFKRIKYALHLPQYLSYLLSGQKFSDLTSIGCHTALWDLRQNNYHEWVVKEGIIDKLAPVSPSDAVFPANLPGDNYQVGIGLHDSSVALIPYLVSFDEPFVLLSTGTWSISLNPFNQSVLTKDELKNDCLNYIQHNGKTVKASRFSIGTYYDEEVKRIAAEFNEDVFKYRDIPYDPAIVKQVLKKEAENWRSDRKGESVSWNLKEVKTDIEAYYRLISILILGQKTSTDLVLKNTSAKHIFVDGGFSQNQVFMRLLAAVYPLLKVYAATVPQSTALGAALAIHGKWNSQPVPHNLVKLKCYSESLFPEH
jgi:sugar (pentulose or hexulose) kinase